MEEFMHRLALQELTKKKFRGHEVLYSKYLPKYPESLEREYQRLSREYIKLLKEIIEEEMLPLKEQIMKERGTYRVDGINDFFQMLIKTFDRMADKFQKKEKRFGLRQKLEELAFRSRKVAAKEWKKSVKSTVGVEILEDYYTGSFSQEILDQWIEENVNLITSIPLDSLAEMKTIAKSGFSEGKSTTRIMKEIQKTYGMSRSKASLLSRDQMGKLNAKLTQAQQKDAGVEEYIWETTGDGRVRQCHKELNGKKFRWDNPPEMYYRTKKGIVYTGRRCNPQEDYQCRCRARSVFRWSTLDVPLGKEMEKKEN